MKLFYSIIDERVTLHIKAQPAASKNEFCGVYNGDAIKIRIKAPAVEGVANEALIGFLAKSFRVPKSAILLKAGQNSKIKRVVFPLTEEFTIFVETMQAEIKK